MTLVQVEDICDGAAWCCDYDRDNDLYDDNTENGDSYDLMAIILALGQL